MGCVSCVFVGCVACVFCMFGGVVVKGGILMFPS